MLHNWLAGEALVSEFIYSGQVAPAARWILDTYEKGIILPRLAWKGRTLQNGGIFPLVFVQSPSCVQLFATPWTTARQASLSFTISKSMLKLLSIELVIPSKHLILCLPFSSCPQSFPASRSLPVSWLFASCGQNIGASASVLFSEYSELISFWIDWFDPLVVQGTLKSLLQHHSSKASTLQHSAFFTVQLSHPYMTTGKTIALTIWTFVGKVMSLLFNTLSRFVIAFLPRSKHLLILWMQAPSAVILEPKNIKSVTVSTISPSICHEVMGLGAMILVFWMLCLKPDFSLSSFTLIKRLFSSSLLSAVRMVFSAYLRLLIFLSAILISALGLLFSKMMPYIQ